MYLPIHPPNAFQPLYYYGFLENKWSIFHILFHIQQYKFLEFTFIQTHTFIRRNLTIGNKQLGSNHICIYKYIYRAHQTRRSGRNSRPISAEVALPRLQSKIKVALFLFSSHSFLANNLHFMIKLIDKAILIKGRYIRMREKGFIQAIRKV